MIAIRAKTWVFWAQVVILGAISALCLLLGGLVLTGIMKPTYGQTDPTPGIILAGIGVGLLPLVALAVFNIVARIRPLIACIDGRVEVNIIGASRLDGVPLIPGYLRVLWAIFSREGFRRHVIVIPCEAVSDVYVYGMPMAKVLVLQIQVVVDAGSFASREIQFHEAVLRGKIDAVAAELLSYCLNWNESPAELPDDLTDEVD